MQELLVLTVCTGNICRSPVAERAVVRHLSARGVPVSARSSGTMGGISNDNTMVQTAAQAGYDISDHVSRPINLAEVAAAHLVLGMDRSHIEHVVAEMPEAWPKTFTLPELVRRAAALPPGTRVPTLADWLALIGQERTTADVLTGGTADDVEDPHGRATGKYRIAVDQINQLSAHLSDLLISQVEEIASSRRF